MQHAASYSPLETSLNASRSLAPPESGLISSYEDPDVEGLQPCNARYDSADGYPPHNERQVGLESYSQPQHCDGLQTAEERRQPARSYGSRGVRRFLNRRLLISGFIGFLVMIVCITLVMCYVTGRFGGR